jgi:Permuted single zf-CXXC unit
MSTEPPKSLCISQDVDELCDKEVCARCASIKEARSRIVRGTILVSFRLFLWFMLYFNLFLAFVVV